jgi:fatty acid desaturase
MFIVLVLDYAYRLKSLESILNCYFQTLGGLNYQIEHHLFPSLPRHNFSHIQKRIQALCREYNIPYHVTGFTDGTM